MNIRNLAARLLFVGFAGIDTSSDEVKYLHNLIKSGTQIGGILLFRHNIVSPDQLKKLVESFKDLQPDIFVAVDQEGGKVQRLNSKKGFKDYYGAEHVANNLDLKQAFSLYQDMAHELKTYGINVNFAPVVDLNPDNGTLCPVIGELGRSYGSNPEVVVAYATTFIDAHHTEGILTSIKHFPGHGYANKDSHKSMVDVTNTWNEKELEPFYKLIDNGKADFIMTAHIINRNFDNQYPATMSKATLDKLLGERKEKSIIVSDDLIMGALVEHYSLEESVVNALNAGCDMLIYSNNPSAFNILPEGYILSPESIEHIQDIVEQAVNDGKLDENTLLNSYNKIVNHQTMLSNNFC